MAAVERVERAFLQKVLALPEPVQRRLAGKPVVIDGLTLATDVQLMLRLQRLARKKGAETMPMPQGRAALLHHTRLTCGRPPIGSVRSLTVAGRPARLYRPTDVDPVVGPGDARPLLVFFHGGGFVYGDLDSHEAPCRFLAERTGVLVLAVDYRLAPEHPFPAAYDDAVAAFRWAHEHAAGLGVDPARIGVGGDSAGGNLAAGVAIEAARAGLPCAVQLLIYPAVDARRTTLSAQLFSAGFYLTAEFMEMATGHYAPSGLDSDDPRLSPALADLPPGLAPALVFIAGFDPLRDEGEAYAERLRAAGAEVTLRRFAGQIHGFLNIVAVGHSAPAANAEIAAALRGVLV